jgi:membrane-associated protease RseP (regulator of RpoE activity)
MINSFLSRRRAFANPIALGLSVLSLVISGEFAHAQSFYKETPLFSTAPPEALTVNTLTRFGPVGMALELHQPAFTMVVGEIEPGSPAEATGALKKGQIIETINGEKLKDIDPRIQLGNIIEKAEATDGAVKFMVKDSAAAAAKEVVVKIPVLGAYSKTWPLNCPKSDKIVRDMADYLVKPGSNKGFADFGMLFLLSTGEEKDIAPVK